LFIKIKDEEKTFTITGKSIKSGIQPYPCC